MVNMHDVHNTQRNMTTTREDEHHHLAGQFENTSNCC